MSFSKQWLVFEPDAVSAMTTAFDEVIEALDLPDKADPCAYIVAKKIIEFARRGEHDPERLRELALNDLRC